MTVLAATTPGAEHGVALAHGIHYAIVAAGIVGILALLLPQLLERVLGTQDPRLRPPRPPRDAHEARVIALRAEIASGALGSRGPSRLVVTAPPALPYAARTLLPAAFVASTAAAGVHAAMAPSHLQHQLAAGLFFLVSTAFQVGWAASLVVGLTRRAAAVGVAANLAFVGLWAVSRTVGVPGLVEVEPVGPWDLACVAWELVVVAACLRLLGSTTTASGTAPETLPAWHRWDGRVSAFAVGSVAVLAALSFSGFSG